MARGRGENRREESKEYVTIKGKIIFPDKTSEAKVLFTMRLFRDVVKKAIVLLKSGLSEAEVKRRLTKFISNAWYSSSAIKKAKTYLKQKRVKFKKPFLFSLGCKGAEKGNRNIRLIDTDRVLVKIPHADGKHEWIKCNVKFGKKHIPLIKELLAGEIAYSSTVVLSNSRYYLHITIPLDLYAKHTRRIFVKKNAKYVAGFDINPDRINMVIINGAGSIIDIQNEHFHDLIQHGYSKNKAREIRLSALSKLIDYGVSHNVKYFIFEKITNVKPNKNKKANRKIAKFAYRQLLQHAEIMVRKRGGVFKMISPAYTSIDAIPLARKLGLDRHTASAYLIALRGLFFLKNHKNT